jgi:hypothetical protein
VSTSCLVASPRASGELHAYKTRILINKCVLVINIIKTLGINKLLTKELMFVNNCCFRTSHSTDCLVPIGVNRLLLTQINTASKDNKDNIWYNSEKLVRFSFKTGP